MTLFVCIAVILGIFISIFLSKKRFGLSTFGLAVGAIISNVWAYEISLLLGSFSHYMNSFYIAIGSGLVILLPAYLLFSRNTVYKTKMMRLLGSLVFTILALAFLIEPLGSFVVLTDLPGEIYRNFVSYKNIIIGSGLIIAVLEVLFSKSESSKKDHEH